MAPGLSVCSPGPPTRRALFMESVAVGLVILNHPGSFRSGSKNHGPWRGQPELGGMRLLTSEFSVNHILGMNSLSGISESPSAKRYTRVLARVRQIPEDTLAGSLVPP